MSSLEWFTCSTRTSAESVKISMVDLFDLHAYDYVLKIILTGDSGVGKSSLARRFTNEGFSSEIKKTLVVEFLAHVINCQGLKIKSQIWDIAGHDRFRASPSSYYKHTKGALIVFDLTMRSSFLSLEKWINEFQMSIPGRGVAVIVGNKLDLTGQRQVSQAEALQLAQKFGFLYIEASALTNANVLKIFETILIEVVKLDRTNSLYSSRNVSFSLSKTFSKKKRKCC